MNLHYLPGEYSICSLTPEEPLPDWDIGEGFYAYVRTDEEQSIICQTSQVPPGITQEADWCCFAVEGPLEFSQVGVLADLLHPLASAGVPVFVVSTYQTDYIMIKQEQQDTARKAWNKAGHMVQDLPLHK
jgi:hypothetical protein